MAAAADKLCGPEGTDPLMTRLPLFGTKIRVAAAMDVHDTVGYDLVAHCVNDILVQGALPLFFLDYIALGRMDVDKVAAIVSGFARGCAEFGCPLIGG